MKVGGQAVVEGVMMKSETKVATAVRILKDNQIKVKTTKTKPRPKIFKLPLLRGIYVLIESLIIGMKALIWSSNQNLDDGEKIKKGEMALTLTLSVVLALGIFIGVPYLITRFFLTNHFLFSLMEGLLRIGIFLGYLAVIRRSKDVKTLFQYHGAEHKVINCYESGEEVNLENAKKYPTIHGRCGTAFIILVLILSIIVFSFIETGWLRILWKLLLIPVIAGLSYEIIKLGDKFKHNFILNALIWPGKQLQKITTLEPTEGQLEVSLKAWKNAV